MKRKLISIVCSIMMIFSACAVLIGCGVKDDPNTVTIWLRSFENWNKNHFQSVIDKLNNESIDGIKINVKFYTEDSFADSLSAAQQNRTAPDIYQVAYQNLWNEYSNGTIKALNDILPQEAFDDLKEEAKNLVYYKGNYLAYPQLIEPSAVLYYNEEFLSKAGITKDPALWTFEDLYAACDALYEKVTDVEKGTYPLAGFTPDQRSWSTMGLQYNLNGGNEPISENWSASQIDTEGYRNFAKFFREMFRSSGRRTGGDDTPYNDHIVELCKQKVGLCITGSWGIAEIMNTYPEMAEKIGIAPIPTLDGNKDGVTATNGGWSFVIDAHSKKTEKAAKVLEYLAAGTSSTDQERIYSFFDAAAFSKIIPRTSIQEMSDERVKGDVPAEWILTIEDVARRSIPEYIFSSGIKGEVAKLIDKVKDAADRVDFNSRLETFISEATTEINRIIALDKLSGKNPKAV